MRHTRKVVGPTEQIAVRISVEAMELLRGLARRERLAGKARTVSDELRDAVATGLQAVITPRGETLPMRMQEADGTPYQTRGIGRLLLQRDDIGNVKAIKIAPMEREEIEARWTREMLGEWVQPITAFARSRAASQAYALQLIVKRGIEAMKADHVWAERTGW